eukprot:2089377-Prymnesium_polylepis.1
MERAPTGAGMDQGQDGMPPGDQGKVEGDDSALAAMELSRTINTSARSLANRVRPKHPFNPLPPCFRPCPSEGIEALASPRCPPHHGRSCARRFLTGSAT